MAVESGLSVDDVKEDARSILEEMSQNLQLSFIRLMGYVLSKVFKRLFSGVFVNVEGLSTVRTADTPHRYGGRSLLLFLCVATCPLWRMRDLQFKSHTILIKIKNNVTPSHNVINLNVFKGVLMRYKLICVVITLYCCSHSCQPSTAFVAQWITYV